MFWASLAGDILRRVALKLLVGALLLVAVFILWPGIVDGTTTGKVPGAFGLISIVHVVVLAVLLKIVTWKPHIVGHGNMGVSTDELDHARQTARKAGENTTRAFSYRK